MNVNLYHTIGEVESDGTQRCSICGSIICWPDGRIEFEKPGCQKFPLWLADISNA